MYSSRIYRMVEEWTTCMRLLSWRRHQGTMLMNCILILPVSDPAKQAAQVVKHRVFDERTVITSGLESVNIRDLFFFRIRTQSKDSSAMHAQLL